MKLIGTACLVLSLIFVLLGCATSYKQRGTGIVGGGYTDGVIDADTFWVTFNGNGYTSGEKAYKYSLKRASEVTLSNGYRYFIISEVSQNESVWQPTYDTVGMQHGQMYKTGEAPLPWTFKFPRVQITFDCYKTKPEVDNVIDANEILQ